MKKLLILGVAIIALQVSSAYAQDAAKPEGEKHHRGSMLKDADANGDGTISKAEFKAHHEKKMEEWFAKLDVDGSGEITQDEATAGLERMREHMKEKMKERREKAEAAASEKKAEPEVKEEAPATEAPAAEPAPETPAEAPADAPAEVKAE